MLIRDSCRYEFTEKRIRILNCFISSSLTRFSNAKYKRNKIFWLESKALSRSYQKNLNCRTKLKQTIKMMVLALIICLLWKLVNKDYLLRASGWFIEFFVDFSFCNQCLQDQRGRRILKIGTWNCASFHREISHKYFPAFSQNCSSILQQKK